MTMMPMVVMVVFIVFMSMVMLMLMAGAFFTVLMVVMMVVMIVAGAFLAVLMVMVMVFTFMGIDAPLAVLAGYGCRHPLQPVLQGFQLRAEHDTGDPYLGDLRFIGRQFAALHLHGAAGGGKHKGILCPPLDKSFDVSDHRFLLIRPEHGYPQLLRDLIPEGSHARCRLQLEFGRGDPGFFMKAGIDFDFDHGPLTFPGKPRLRRQWACLR